MEKQTRKGKNKPSEEENNIKKGGKNINKSAKDNQQGQEQKPARGRKKAQEDAENRAEAAKVNNAKAGSDAAAEKPKRTRSKTSEETKATAKLTSGKGKTAAKKQEEGNIKKGKPEAEKTSKSRVKRNSGKENSASGETKKSPVESKQMQSRAVEQKEQKPKQQEEQKPQIQQDGPVWYGFSLLSEFDVHLFRGGKHYKLYEKLGSHVTEVNGTQGVFFAVWAPDARDVYVMGSFNGWDKRSHRLGARWDGSGIWEGFVPNAKKGDVYKYFVISRFDNRELEKGDPYAFTWETPPNTASIVWDLDYDWKDSNWLERRKEKNKLNQPFSVYEMHFASWRRKTEEDNRSLTYREMADELVPYLEEMGFTHVEFMPIMEHPFGGSWGYQVTGYFAPSSRFGTPQDFMYLIDKLHQANIGIIVDWVPSHFPGDAHGLFEFDGSHLYEHADIRKGFHPDWNSYIFNYGRNEVRAFLISSALFWLDKYHMDGIRVDAVASMLYLDYSRKDGEWIPNEFGNNENLEAISFLKEFNEAVYSMYPDTQTIAEESTAWPKVSRPTYDGGLGFGMKWMMGWMHDTLSFFSKESIYRRYHQNEITFSFMYAFNENFMLPLSHDEVVYGKGALVKKMPGDEWQRFANLRLLFANMYMHPGTKLIFMGGEFGQTEEWNHDESLHWHLLQYDPHNGMKEALKDLNKLYKNEPALYEHSFSEEGFEWIDYGDADNSIIAYIRKGQNEKDQLLVLHNFTPIVREDYRIGVPKEGDWHEIFNTDKKKYWGSGVSNKKIIESEKEYYHSRPHSIKVTLPPLATIVFKHSG